MKLLLDRNDKCGDGVFGRLLDARHNQLFVTLEHAYLQPNGTFISKIPDGTYTCKNNTGPLENGMHCLHDGVPFVAFQVQDVPDFNGQPVTNILFHVGNYNRDSEGCVLLGTGAGHKQGVDYKTSGGKMIVNSKVAFDEFMTMLKGQDSFDLVVSSC